MYVLQLVLHLPEGSDIRHQIFHTLDMEDLECKNRWNTANSLLGKNYKSNGTAVVLWYCSSIQYLEKIGALSYK